MSDAATSLITIPPLLLALSTGGPDGARPTVVFLHGLLLAFAVGALGTNVFHKWAHAPSVPPGVRWLQRRGDI